MKFSTREDIEAPIEGVFDMLCDFEGFERSAMRRGAEVQRVDRLPKPGVGMIWDVVFSMRGKMRNPHTGGNLAGHRAAEPVGAPVGTIVEAGQDVVDQTVQAARGRICQNDGRAL